MIRSRHGFKALGLCAVVLGLMAFSTSAAQAEVGAKWNVNGSAISATLLPAIGATLEGSHGILLSKALGVPLNILCTAIGFVGATLKAEGGALGKIKFTGCKVLKGTEVLASCEPHNGATKGEILTNTLKGLIVLDAGQPVTLLIEDETKVGAEPTFVSIETSEACSFGAKIPVIGEFVLSDCSKKEAGVCIPEGTVEKKIHLGLELASLTKLFVISLTEEHKATIDGSIEGFLTGAAHEGLNWSAKPA